ncbi:MAG: fibrillarin-like rRNA/tRNA 2'-O-methyltransferase [Candidatus Nanohaloarchaea archaeon]|nr:fibrillarin-like rRNA/tRNA 2'-O-methyltransferase [Candidatus Nanohaloarchaea archaeon]
MEELFPGVYQDGDALYTRNLVPGETVYGEDLVEEDVEYRRWDPHRSKAAAALTKDLSAFPVDEESAVLYLGASTGTTVSHVSDIAASGFVYAVEYAPAIARKLLQLGEQRENVAPILGDARTPEEYAPLCSEVDVIYQDVAQRDQVRILEENADTFLTDDGHALLAIKAQSIASEKEPAEVFAEAKEQLREQFEIVAGKKLEPFHENHLFLVLKRGKRS